MSLDRPGVFGEKLARVTGGHAAYPSGLSTLCGLPTGTLVREPGPPDCLDCQAAAIAFDRIDNSAPAAWFRRRATTTAR